MLKFACIIYALTFLTCINFNDVCKLQIFFRPHACVTRTHTHAHILAHANPYEFKKYVIITLY